MQETSEVTGHADVDLLKDNARLWVTLDDEERQARIVLREIATKKKALNKSIIKGLEVVDVPHISFLRGGVLRPCERMTYAPLNKEEIIITIRTEVGDEAKADSIIDKLYNKHLRESKKTVALKFNRGST
jgi:hypothetical protein